MNIWLAKLGENKLTSDNKIELQGLLESEFVHHDQQASESFEYKSNGVHFLSYDLTSKGSGKTYYYIDSKNRMTAYSGNFVGTNPDITDYRSAESIHAHSEDPSYFDSHIAGSYAVIAASASNFQCFVDNLGLHKVFYFRAPDNHMYVTNDIKLLKFFKKPEINELAFMDWIAFESVLSLETEEKGIHTLPYYGRLRWSNEESKLHIDQYKNVSDIVYNDTPENILFDKVVSDFKSSARYLTNYHTTTFTLSGGYDSRLVLSMFSGMDIKNMDSYSYYDNYYDVSIAKKVAKDFGINHRVLKLSNELPSFTVLHNYLQATSYPYFKYSDVFSYLVRDSLKDLYSDNRHRVVLKGMGGNSDRFIFKKIFLDNYDEKRAIIKLTETSLKHLDTAFFTKDAYEDLFNRLQSHYITKYMPVISGRKNGHKLKYLLYKERYEGINRGFSATNASHSIDQFLPLLMDSYQSLIFNCDERGLHRGHRNSIYHRLFTALTGGKGKPIHFSSGLHWEASKLSRGIYRLKHHVIEKNLKKAFNFRGKITTRIKSGFYDQSRSEAMELLLGSENSFLWDYLNRDVIINHYENSSDYSDANTQLIFKSILPILKLEMDGSLGPYK